MTNQPVRTSRFKRVVYGIIAVVAIIALFVGLRVYSRMRSQAVIRPQVIAAVRANFPDFCVDSEIFAEPSPFPHNTNALLADHDSIWGIKCDAWMKSSVGYQGEVTLVDIDRCTTIRPIVGTTSEYYNEYETINATNGQPLSSCK